MQYIIDIDYNGKEESTYNCIMIGCYFELPAKEEIQFGGSTYLPCLALPSIILWDLNFFLIWYKNCYPAPVRLSVVFLDIVDKNIPWDAS